MGTGVPFSRIKLTTFSLNLGVARVCRFFFNLDDSNDFRYVFRPESKSY